MRTRITLIAVTLLFSLITMGSKAVAPQGSTVTVTRELRSKTGTDGAAAGAWIITVKCGKESFGLTFDQYIALGYYDAVHNAEEAGAKVEFSGSTKLERVNGVATILDVMSQSTSYQGRCPRPK